MTLIIAFTTVLRTTVLHCDIHKTASCYVHVRAVVHDEWNADCKKTPQGLGYTGKISITADGATCLDWHHYLSGSQIKDQEFADGNIIDAENFCRNPHRFDTNTKDRNPTLWCLVKDDKGRPKGADCAVPLCSKYEFAVCISDVIFDKCV